MLSEEDNVELITEENEDTKPTNKCQKRKGRKIIFVDGSVKENKIFNAITYIQTKEMNKHIFYVIIKN